MLFCSFAQVGTLSDREIEAHVPEDFWHIQVTYTEADGKKCDFSWDRGRLFDHTAATILYEMCVEEPLATVTKASCATMTQLCHSNLITVHPRWC